MAEAKKSADDLRNEALIQLNREIISLKALAAKHENTVIAEIIAQLM